MNSDMRNAEAVELLMDLQTQLESGILGYYPEEFIEALEVAIDYL